MFYYQKSIKERIQDFYKIKEIISKLKREGIKPNQTFRAKQLKTVSHSGSLLVQLCNFGVLQAVATGKEPITITKKEKMYRSLITNQIITPEVYRKNKPHFFEPIYEEVKKVIESEFNIYIISENWKEILLEELKLLEKDIQLYITNLTVSNFHRIEDLSRFFENIYLIRFPLEQKEN